MMGKLGAGLRRILDGPVVKALLPRILELAEREGMLRVMAARSPFAADDLCAALETELGYDLSSGNRRRMIRVLLDILAECGWLARDGRAWRWSRDAGGAPPCPPGAAPDGDVAGDEAFRFFAECLRSVPSYLRGGSPAVLFDEESSGAWERFLGCADLNASRVFLLDMMGIRNTPSFHLLDLCHGPGWGVEAAVTLFPAIRVSAIDFTDGFCRRAKERAARAVGRNRAGGLPEAAVTWLGPERWGGFGHALPFADGAFDAVLFSCGDPYVPRALRGPVYGEMARVLAPGGRLGVLTWGYPDAERRHVPSFWVRVAALAHDFSESVCQGWEGFSDVEESVRLFSGLGFRGSDPRQGRMSFLESSVWVLTR